MKEIRDDSSNGDDRVILLLSHQKKNAQPKPFRFNQIESETVLPEDESQLSKQVQGLKDVMATLESLSPREVGSEAHQMLYSQLESGIQELSEKLLSVSYELDEMTDKYHDLDSRLHEPRICSITGAVAHDDPLRIDLANLFNHAKQHISAKSFLEGFVPSIDDVVGFETDQKGFASLIYIKIDILPYITVCDSEERGNDLLGMTAHCLRRAFGHSSKIHRRGTHGLAFAVVAYGLNEMMAEQRVLAATGQLREQCRDIFVIEPDIIYGISDSLSAFSHLGLVLDERHVPPFPIDDSRLVTNLIEVTQRIAQSRLEIKGVLSYLLRLSDLYRTNQNRFEYLSKWLLPNVIDIDDPLEAIEQLAQCRSDAHLPFQTILINEKIFLDRIMNQVSERILETLVHRCSGDIPGIHANDLEFYAYSYACEEAIEWINE